MTDAGIAIQLIDAVSAVLTAMVLAVVVIYTAVVTNITRSAHTPANAQSSGVEATSCLISRDIVAQLHTHLGPVGAMRQVD